MYRMEMPQDAIDLISRLNQNGYDAYAVGGCIRDSMLGRVPKDWDIASNAEPDAVKVLFDKTFDTGQKHGTVTVIMGGNEFEVTTFRIDGEYKDGRHPSSVRYTESILQDLSRRDFTINAMAYHPISGLLDPFGGNKDISEKLIKTVGNPAARFEEDALRMLRAVRFSAQLSFEVDPGTISAIKQCKDLIDRISRERVRDEFEKIILSPRPDAILLLLDTGLLDRILPELSVCFCTEQNHPYHVYDVGRHIIKSMEAIDSGRLLRWTMLLHDIGKPLCKSTDAKGIDHFYGHQAKSASMAGDILERLKMDRKTINNIVSLVKYHDIEILPDEYSVKKAVIKVGEELFLPLLEVMKADKKAQNPRKLEDRLEKLTKIKAIYEQIREQGQCLSISGLAINGNDLMEMGFTEGRKVGETLRKLLTYVLKDNGLNKKDRLITLAKQLKH